MPSDDCSSASLIQVVCPYPDGTAEAFAWWRGIEAGVGMVKAILDSALPDQFPPAEAAVDRGGNC
jgi:hypothetical protein